MVGFGAHQLPPPVLPERQKASLCGSYLEGYCKNGNNCRLSHELCRVSEAELLQPWATEIAATSPNFLSIKPRKRPLPNEVFDSDGPGFFSLVGPRHDNDHADIRNIRILPTTDEILSKRLPFMPSKDLYDSHVWHDGQPKLVDALFRMLRYENTEVLIDVSYRAAQMLASPNGGSPYGKDLIRQETPRGNKFSLFKDIKLEDFSFDERSGLIVRVSYHCPRAFRGHGNMSKSGFLERGRLVALVGLDADDRNVSVTFFEVHLRQSTEAMLARGGNGVRASVQLSFAQRDSRDDVTRMLLYKTSMCRGKFVLVEFPNALLPGFSSCLKQLQDLLYSIDLPFTRFIAPSLSQETLPDINPPAYARQPGFSFNLSSLRRQEKSNNVTELRMSCEEVKEDHQRVDFLNVLKKETSLDEGQSTALVECLSRELAFTQGPPGTGKTYLGVSLAKAILASQPEDSPKPIIAVCMTNHALDSFLEDLKREGIGSIVRLGGGSKKEWTKPHLLKEVSRKMKLGIKENRELYSHRACVEALFSQGMKWCAAINGDEFDWQIIKEHLAAHYPEIYSQFSPLEGTEADSSNRKIARKATGFVYYCWTQGMDIVSLPALFKDFATYLGVDPAFEDSSSAAPAIIQALFEKITARCRKGHDLTAPGAVIWLMSLTERRILISQWKKEIGVQLLVDQLAEIHFRHYSANQKRLKIRDEIDARCLRSQQVIGVTTTACAANWNLLNKVRARVVICEEAGEVMEAHSLCTLFPSVEHAVFIGDPLQLRPHVREQALSQETKIGSRYRLDESLFQRLISPGGKGIDAFPISRLSLQRRMHPDIADLSRATLYPYLKDHRSTLDHRRVAGMVHRTYWLDHQMPEDTQNQSVNAKNSFSNIFEVEMVAGLVNYLISGNEYGLNDIAVLTPYNGQLALLTKFLSQNCSVWLSENDRVELMAAGLLCEENARYGYKTNVGVLDMLRVATVDNFQGEEAKIVIFSAVRSNSEGNIGFVKTENRINVACSRARDGFYIIGNSKVIRKVPMWNKIINVFASKKRLGTRFMTSCSRHPHRVRHVSVPLDWEKAGHCPLPCGNLLSCGHFCKEKCHDPDLHNRMKCLEPCMTVLKCGHKSQDACGDPCRDCDLSRRFVLPCGHTAFLPCRAQDNLSEICCGFVKRTERLPCGHVLKVTCHEIDKPRRCKEKCGAVLQCGHLCRSSCAECAELPAHPPCQVDCKKHRACGHDCSMSCHPGDCPRCEPCFSLANEPIKTATLVFGEGVKSILRTGKRVASLASSLENSSDMLVNQFDAFCEKVQPGPFSADANQTLVHARGNYMTKVQEEIIAFKNDNVIPFERDHLHVLSTIDFEASGNDPEWAFSTQLDFLFRRCRLVTLKEAVRTVRHLRLVPDVSERLPAIAEALQVLTSERTRSNIKSIKELIAHCEAHNLHFLQGCVRLTQLEFHLVAKLLNVQDEDEIERDLDEGRLFCQKHPWIAKRLADAFDQIREALHTDTDGEPESEPDTQNYNFWPEEYWRRWMEGDGQYLKQCANGHLYLNESSERCIECGEESGTRVTETCCKG